MLTKIIKIQSQSIHTCCVAQRTQETRTAFQLQGVNDIQRIDLPGQKHCCQSCVHGDHLPPKYAHVELSHTSFCNQWF